MVSAATLLFNVTMALHSLVDELLVVRIQSKKLLRGKLVCSAIFNLVHATAGVLGDGLIHIRSAPTQPAGSATGPTMFLQVVTFRF